MLSYIRITIRYKNNLENVDNFDQKIKQFLGYTDKTLFIIVDICTPFVVGIRNCVYSICENNCSTSKADLEKVPRFELRNEVLQTSILPLDYTFKV